jgi:hypothetical protein
LSSAGLVYKVNFSYKQQILWSVWLNWNGRREEVIVIQFGSILQYGGEVNRGEHNFSALNFGFPPILVGFGGGENISLKYFTYID